MVALPIGPAQRFVVVASPAYLAAHGAPRTPHELPGHACVRLRFPSGAIYRWDFARDGEALEVEVNVAPMAFAAKNEMMVSATCGM